MSKQKLISVLYQYRSLFKTDQKAIDALDYLEKKVSELEFDNESSETERYPLPKEIQGSNDYALFSDGGCRGNPGPGSWGVLGQNSSGEVIFEGSSFDDHTTNNQMELLGALKSLELFQESVDDPFARIYLFTDSKYVVDGLTSWIKGWKKRNWKKADGKPVLNQELWKSLDDMRNSFSFFKAIWVKGHNGHPQNERCDELCNIILDRELL